MCGKYPDRHGLHVFHQQPPRRPSTTVSQKAYELQWGCPIRTTTLTLTGAKQVLPNLSVSKRQGSRSLQLKPLLAPPLAGCTERARRQRCAGAAFPDVPPRKGHVSKAGSGPEGSGREKKPSPGNHLFQEPAPGSVGVCSGRDGVKVTPGSWSFGLPGPEGPGSKWSLRGALYGVWRYSPASCAVALPRWG